MDPLVSIPTATNTNIGPFHLSLQPAGFTLPEWVLKNINAI